MSDTNYPNHVRREETPEATPETVSEDVLHAALSIATRYVECPECSERQFIPVMSGHNTTWDCRECDFEMRVVG